MQKLNSFKEDENYDLFSTIKITQVFSQNKPINIKFSNSKLSFRYSPDRNSNYLLIF